METNCKKAGLLQSSAPEGRDCSKIVARPSLEENSPGLDGQKPSAPWRVPEGSPLPLSSEVQESPPAETGLQLAERPVPLVVDGLRLKERHRGLPFHAGRQLLARDSASGQKDRRPHTSCRLYWPMKPPGKMEHLDEQPSLPDHGAVSVL